MPLRALWTSLAGAIALCTSWAARSGDTIWATRGQTTALAPPPIELPADRRNDGRERRAISLKDIVSLRELHQPKVSPDGSQVAFVVRQAFLSCNCYRSALYVASTRARSQPKKLLEDDLIQSLQWAPDGSHLSFLSARGGAIQLWWVDARTGALEQLLTHTPGSTQSFDQAIRGAVDNAPASGILSYAWSPDGRQIAYTTEAARDPDKKLSAERYGFRYDPTAMLSEDLVLGNWVGSDRAIELWTFDFASKSSRLQWVSPRHSMATISNITWAPDGGAMAFIYGRAVSQDTVALLQLESDQGVQQLPSPSGTISAIQWDREGQHIGVVSREPWGTIWTLSVIETSAARLNVISREIAAVGFPPFLVSDENSGGFILTMDGIETSRQQAGLYRVSLDGHAKRLTALENRIADCDSAARVVTACILQSPSLAPRVALVNLGTAKVTPLVDPNPETSALELSPVEHLRWTNELGHETDGYLLMPRRPPSQGRVPLVIIAYGYNGEFVTHASPTLTSYPAQLFPRDGIAALLVNYPRYHAWKEPDFERTVIAEGESPLSSLKVIVQKLAEERNIDPCRVGFMGHSWGGFWVQYTITQSDLVQVAEIHSGGSSVEPGMFWLMGSQRYADLQKHIMGGGPYGEYLQNYLRFSPSLNARNIRTPVLMQYGAMEARWAMEFYFALREHNVPVDYIVYPGAVHVFTQPTQRMASMRRTLDWFEFWLLDRENPDPVDPMQYETWRELHKAQSLKRTSESKLGPGLCKRP